MKGLLGVAMVVTGVFISLGGVGYALVNKGMSDPGPAPIPRQVANLPLSRAASGWQAASEVARLHGKELALNSAGVGVYGPEQSITIWAAGAPLKPLAGRMLSVMRDKISEGNSPFAPLGERRDGKRIVYELEGLGQKHFYFQSGNLIVWLAADAELAEPALEQTLEFYR